MQENRFFDTSILVYAFDSSDEAKHKIAAELIADIINGGEKGTVSVQVLLELYNVLTRFLSHPIPASEAALIVNKFAVAERWNKLEYGLTTATRAVATAAKYGIEVWDALLIETMKEKGISTIVTENEKDFKKVPGIKIINPFK